MKQLQLTVLFFLLATIVLLSCKKELSSEGSYYPTNPPVNNIPVANAGVDQVITLPKDSVLLDGSNSSIPNGSITIYQWEKIAGPYSVITSPTNVRTEVTNMSVGIYKFELMVTDGLGAMSKDTMQVTVYPAYTSQCGIFNRPQRNASLTDVGALSQARFPYAGTVGSKIVFAGGGYYATDGFWVSSNVDIFDVNSRVWTNGLLSMEREGMAVTSCGNKLFFAGGGTCGYLFGNGLLDLFYSNIDIYDASTNTWSLAQLSEPRTYLTAAVAGNKIVFAGGLGNDYEVSDKVDIYDLSTNSWSIAKLSEARVDPRAVTVGDKIYIAGGYKAENCASSRVDIYNAGTNSWSTASLRELCGGVSGAVKGNQIFWAGETNTQNTTTGKVEIWNTTNGSIITHCLSYARYAPMAVVRNNEVAFFTDNAWWNDHALISDRFDIYNTETGQWSNGILPLSIASPAIISVNNTIYMAGGKTSAYKCTNKMYTVNW